jgi:hypothetical protein
MDRQDAINLIADSTNVQLTYKPGVSHLHLLTLLMQHVTVKCDR